MLSFEGFRLLMEYHSFLWGAFVVEYIKPRPLGFRLLTELYSFLLI